MKQEARLRIVLNTPPAGVDFGLQVGRGARCEIIQKQRSAGKDLSYEFAVEVRTGRDGAARDFFGPVVQGPPGARFIYLAIGTYAGQDSPWSRRLKVPLSGITLEMLQRLAKDPPAVLETRVQGTGRDGGPNCGTVTPFGGWKLDA